MRTLKLSRPYLRGRDVFLLQKRLTVHDFAIECNGVFDAKVYLALKRFQSRYNLPMTGVVESSVWSVLVSDPVVQPRISPIREQFVGLVSGFYGTPFIWGSSAPWVGLDSLGLFMHCMEVFNEKLFATFCSETVDELRTKCGEHARTVARAQLLPGDLVFYSREKSGPATLVTMALGNDLVLGSIGGNTATIDLRMAFRRGAGVQIKNIDFRNHICGMFTIEELG